jgi:hypothetical protein
MLRLLGVLLMRFSEQVQEIPPCRHERPEITILTRVRLNLHSCNETSVAFINIQVIDLYQMFDVGSHDTLSFLVGTFTLHDEILGCRLKRTFQNIA